MSDSSINYKTEQQRLKMQILAQRHQIEKQRLDIMEMSDRVERHLVNIASAEKAIGEYEFNLAKLEDAHGTIPDDALDTALERLESSE